MKKCLTMLLAAVMCLSMTSMAVMADDARSETESSVSAEAGESAEESWPIPEGQSPSDAPSVEIPATIVLKGAQPNPAEDYIIELTADDASYPMPQADEESSESAADKEEPAEKESEPALPSYRLTITGADTKTFPPIVFDKVGIYTYTVKQIPGENARCTYDETVYKLKITVFNSPDYNGMYIVTKVYTEDEPEVKKELIFTNTYPTASSSSSSTSGGGDDEDDEDEVTSAVKSKVSAEPEEPSINEPEDEDNASPDTGDHSQVGLFAFLFVASAAVLLVVLVQERKYSAK